MSSLEVQNQGLQSELTKLTSVNSDLQLTNSNLTRVVSGLQSQVDQMGKLMSGRQGVEKGEVTCEVGWMAGSQDFR